MPSRRLVLLGGGHAHVQVVRAFAAAPPPDTDVLLLSDGDRTPYSGMLPGLVAGHYHHAEAHIDLPVLCAAAGVRFVNARAVGLAPSARRLDTPLGAHDYDILSIDTGSTTPVAAIAGGERHAVPVKPVPPFLRAVDECVDRARRGIAGPIAVVGAGAAGFEIALALDHRLRHATGNGRRPALTLYADRDGALPGFPDRTRRIGTRILARQEVAVQADSRVEEILRGGVRLANGTLEAADTVFLTIGAAPAPMFRDAGLRTDAHGCVEVHPTLQSVSHAEIFACGDAATVREHPRPKAGVFAVRQGPPLAANLVRAFRGEHLRPFVPQREFLVLLGTGGNHGIGVRNGFTVHGRWVWWWKQRIDRRFMARFTPSAIAATRHR